MQNIPVWEDGDWRDLPALSSDIDADVCVVGLGGSGLSCIGELLDLGVRRVVGIDASQIAGGAAGRNGGFLLAGMARFYHEAAAALGSERARRIYELTLEQIDRIAVETPEVVRRVGALRIAASAEELEDCDAQLAAMLRDGLPAERYRGEEGEGLLFPTDGVFSPLARCRALARQAIERGASLHERTPALAVSGTRVTTPRATIRCERAIVAVDGMLERVFPELEGRVRTARLQMLATAPAPEVRFPRPVYYRWGYEYWQQLPNGSVALGGFRDRCGEEEWTHDAVPTEVGQELLEGFLRERLRVTAPVTHRWAAPVSFASGVLPLLEQPRPGVWAVGGYSGTGNVLGALCGRAAAQLAVRGESELAVVSGG